MFRDIQSSWVGGYEKVSETLSENDVRKRWVGGGFEYKSSKKLFVKGCQQQQECYVLLAATGSCYGEALSR